MTPDPAVVAKRVFLVFEGGGAKGIVHVGALRALEKQGVEIGGVAGTSAGAIVSALVAAGYSSRELVGEDGSSPLLTKIGLAHAKEFFGADWDRLALARWAASDIPVAGFLAFLPCAALAYGSAMWLGASLAEALLVFLAAAITLAILLAYRCTRGLVRLDLLVEKLELALSRKLGLELGEPVLFRHFDHVGRPLRIVATDLAARRLMLFSSATTPNVRVAEAVAASAALPLACEHRIVENRRFIDGGIVSNLPAWTFDEERALDPDAVTVAISIDDGRTVPAIVDLSPHRVLISILLAAMFGRRHLETRASPRLLNVTLRTDIQVIDFDLSPEQAREAVANAERAAEVLISEQLFKLPKRFEEACEKLRMQVDGRVSPANLPPGARTRVMVALRDPGSVASWRIRFGSGLAPTDADDQLLLPEQSTVIGHSVLLERPILEAQPFSPEVALSGPANRYRNALVRRDLEWCLAIPIYKKEADEGADPLAVVAIDSNVAVQYFAFDVEFVDALAAAAEILVRPVVELARVDFDG